MSLEKIHDEPVSVPIDALRRWLASEGNQPVAHRGKRSYQGAVFFYECDGQRLAVKAPRGRGLVRWLSQWMIRREFRIYQRLEGMQGVPRCYGLLDRRYLLLEHVDGATFRERQRQLRQQPQFFAKLWSTVEELHRRGIAHTDLKTKDNVMLRDDDQPCLIDFGAAVTRKPGFAPVNHMIYRIARQFDYNACIKLRHKGYDDLDPFERARFRRLFIERATHSINRFIRKTYRRLAGRRRPRPRP